MTYELGSISSNNQRDTPRDCTKQKAFIERRMGQRTHQQEKKESSLEKSKSSGDNGFSLAKLQHFHWLVLLLSRKKIFLPAAGTVKKLYFLFKSVKVHLLRMGSVIDILLFGEVVGLPNSNFT